MKIIYFVMQVKKSKINYWKILLNFANYLNLKSVSTSPYLLFIRTFTQVRISTKKSIYLLMDLIDCHFLVDKLG